MRVLHVNDSKGWRGGENQTFLLIKGLQQAGNHCVLLAQKGSPLALKCRDIGCTVYSNEFHGISSIAAPCSIRTLCKKFTVDCIHAHTARAHTLAVLSLWGFSSRIPLVVTRRNLPNEKPGVGTRYKYKRTTHIISISKAISERLTKIHIPSAKLSVIPSGLDLSKYENVPALPRAELKIDAGKKIIGIVAALTSEKGHETVLGAAQKLKRRGDDIHVLFVGDGPRRDFLESKVKDMKLANDVTFTGHRNDIGRILPLLDVYVSASNSEGLGTANLDALLAGIPVVATRVGGVPEVITDQVNGLLFTVGDSDSLAKHISSLFENEQLRTSLIKQGYDQVRKFDIRDTVARTMNVYSRVCA